MQDFAAELDWWMLRWKSCAQLHTFMDIDSVRGRHGVDWVRNCTGKCRSVHRIVSWTVLILAIEYIPWCHVLSFVLLTWVRLVSSAEPSWGKREMNWDSKETTEFFFVSRPSVSILVLWSHVGYSPTAVTRGFWWFKASQDADKDVLIYPKSCSRIVNSSWHILCADVSLREKESTNLSISMTNPLSTWLEFSRNVLRSTFEHWISSPVKGYRTRLQHPVKNSLSTKYCVAMCAGEVRATDESSTPAIPCLSYVAWTSPWTAIG